MCVCVRGCVRARACVCVYVCIHKDMRSHLNNVLTLYFSLFARALHSNNESQAL